MRIIKKATFQKYLGLHLPAKKYVHNHKYKTNYEII